MTVPITGNLTETQRFPAPSLDGVAWQAARAGRQLRISASQKPLERDTQRRGPVLRKALPPRTPSNFHISHKNHWTTGKKNCIEYSPHMETTAWSSCGRQATRALVRPVYQPIQTVGAEKDRTRRHPGPDGSGRSVGASRARDQNAPDISWRELKAYQGTVRLGQTTDTWDADGQITAEAPWDHVTAEAVADVIAGWVGTSEQPVPPYSAAKHQGQPLYKLSREGKETPLKIKTIEISRAEVLRVELPYVTFRVICSSGTYIRSLAHSLGTRLGCGAVLTELIREYSHPFGLDRACPLDTLLAEPETLPERVIPVTAALPHWPTITVTGHGRGGHEKPARSLCGRKRAARAPEHRTERTSRAFPAPTPSCSRPTGSRLALAEAVSGGPAWKVLRGTFGT